MKQPTLSPAQRLWPVMALLVFMFFLRAHHITVQEPFIDEGAHVARANAVRSFEQHPAREANGKLLLYLWLGLFELPPITALYVSRTAIALFSLINGAALYTLGRQIGSHTVGLLALGGYAVLPLAFFFERIALADPLAAALVSVLAWRSMIFARRPSLREGGVVGVWVALAMLAKLTVGLIPLLPVAAAFVFYSWQSSDGWRPQLARWTGTYLPGLLVAAGVVTLFWLPVVIPALLAKLDGDPFVLVYGENLQPLESTAPLRELRSILPQISKYTTPEFLVISVLALGYLLWAGRSHPALLRNALFLAAWLMLITVLSLVASTGIRSRYLMPTAGPLVLSLAYAGVWAWQTTRLRGIVRGAIVLGGMIWLVTFALPFVYTAWTDPGALPLSLHDRQTYFGGNFAGDAFRQTARLLEEVDPPAEHVYASLATCDMLYFFTAKEVHCLGNVKHPVELGAHDVTYLVFNGHEWRPNTLGLDWELIAYYERPRLVHKRNVRVWRVWARPADIP